MDAVLCAKLTQLYDGNPNVRVYCAGLSNATMVMPYRMFSIGLENTLQKDDRQYDNVLGAIQRMGILLDAKIVCKELALFNCQHRILSIDIEGHEPIVLPRINCTFDIVITETPLFHNRNCKKLFRKQYNDVYECDPKDSVLATE